MPTAPADPLEGQPAPGFTLTADDGSEVTLSELRGSAVVLYFYSKDDTRSHFDSRPA